MAGSVTIKTRRFLVNRVLNRKQFIVDISHPNAKGLSKTEVKDKLVSLYKIADPQTVIVFGLKTAFGGSKTTGFGLIYDNVKSLKKFEPKYRQARAGFLELKSTLRKQRKERKNRALKVRGKAKAKILGKK